MAAQLRRIWKTCDDTVYYNRRKETFDGQANACHCHRWLRLRITYRIKLSSNFKESLCLNSLIAYPWKMMSWPEAAARIIGLINMHIDRKRALNPVFYIYSRPNQSRCRKVRF